MGMAERERERERERRRRESRGSRSEVIVYYAKRRREADGSERASERAGIN